MALTNFPFPLQHLLFERVVDFTISLNNKNLRSPVFVKLSFRSSSQQVFNKKDVLKKILKISRKKYMPEPLFQ